MSGSLTALALNPATAGLYRQDVVAVDAGIINTRNSNSNGGTLGNATGMNINNAGFLARNAETGYALATIPIKCTVAVTSQSK